MDFIEDDLSGGERVHHRYERMFTGKTSSHNEDTCAYCQNRIEKDEAALRRRMEELEPLFEDAGVGRSQEDDIDDAPSDSDDLEQATVYPGPCNGVLDIVFTGLTEERHGNAWCHYIYYGRVREWDGLIVLIGVPVSPVYMLSLLPVVHGSLTSVYVIALRVVLSVRRTM